MTSADSPPTNKAGEPYEYIYYTSYPVNIQVAPTAFLKGPAKILCAGSDMMFYKTLRRLAKEGMVSEMARLSAEAHKVHNKYTYIERKPKRQ